MYVSQAWSKFFFYCFFFFCLFIFTSDYDNENNGNGERQGKRRRPRHEPLSIGVEKRAFGVTAQETLMSPGPMVFFFLLLRFFFYLPLPPPLFGGFFYYYYYDGRNRLQHAQRPEMQRREIKGARDVETCLGPVVCFFSSVRFSIHC